jgi:hypothetical protein
MFSIKKNLPAILSAVITVGGMVAVAAYSNRKLTNVLYDLHGPAKGDFSMHIVGKEVDKILAGTPKKVDLGDHVVLYLVEKSMVKD